MSKRVGATCCFTEQETSSTAHCWLVPGNSDLNRLWAFVTIEVKSILVLTNRNRNSYNVPAWRQTWLNYVNNNLSTLNLHLSLVTCHNRGIKERQPTARPNGSESASWRWFECSKTSQTHPSSAISHQGSSWVDPSPCEMNPSWLDTGNVLRWVHILCWFHRHAGKGVENENWVICHLSV